MIIQPGEFQRYDLAPVGPTDVTDVTFSLRECKV
jgi:hypothetical protein